MLLRLSLRDLRAHVGRYLLTFVAVAIGVAFVGGVNALTDTLATTFDDLFSGLNAGTDAWVRGEVEFETDPAFGDGEQRRRIDVDLVERVMEVDGVAGVDPYVEGFAEALDEDGDEVSGGALGPPTRGASWRTVPDLNPFELDDGSRPPRRAGEVVLDRGLAEELGAGVGDVVPIETHRGVTESTVVGVAGFGTADSPLGAHYVLFDLGTAERELAEAGQVDGIGVLAARGVGQDELRDRLAEALDDAPVEVVTGAAYTEETQDDLAEQFRFFRIVLLVFAVLAVVVGAFVIYTSFSFIVAQRQRQIALLRAIGASRRQVLASVVLESLTVGVLASLAGYVVGLGLAAGLSGLLVDDPAPLTVRPLSLALALGVGIVVTLLSAVVPAWRAANVPPVAALLEVAVDTTHRSGRRLAAGLVLLGGGLVAVVSVLAGGDDGGGGGADIRWAGEGLVALVLGLVVLGPLAARPAAVVLGAPLPRWRGIVGRLARQNAGRNPRRTAATASALMICMGAVTMILVVVASIAASVDELVDRRFRGDFVVSSGEGFGGRGAPDRLTAEIAGLDGVEAAAGLRFGLAEVAGDGQGIVGIDPTRTFDVYDLGAIEGDIRDLAEDDGIAVFSGTAEEQGWELGDEVEVRFQDTGVQAFRIVALTGTDELLDTYVLGNGAFDANVEVPTYAQIVVRAAGGASLAAVRDELDAVTADYPTAEVMDLSGFAASARSQFDPLLTGVLVLLALTVVVAVIGVVNTLVLSILERAREIGLLRAVGATRAQIRAAIRWEAVLIGAFGVVAALVTGVLGGGVVVRALRDEGFTTFAVPFTQLAGVAVTTAFLSLAAALLPATWAARRPTLDAIALD